MHCRDGKNVTLAIALQSFFGFRRMLEKREKMAYR
jgi:hypothetical protein